jgi:hypothetical protein
VTAERLAEALAAWNTRDPDRVLATKNAFRKQPAA